jgi:hypothetical protein
MGRSGTVGGLAWVAMDRSAARQRMTAYQKA